MGVLKNHSTSMLKRKWAGNSPNKAFLTGYFITQRLVRNNRHVLVLFNQNGVSCKQCICTLLVLKVQHFVNPY